MKRFIQYLSFIGSLVLVLGLISWGSTLHAQSPDQQQSPSSPSTQQPSDTPPPTPDTPPAAQQRPHADSPSAQTPDAANGQTQVFSGTVTKQGSKYVLKDDAGKTYDIDHQDDVKKFDGKRVRVQGTLDSTGTMIMVK